MSNPQELFRIAPDWRQNCQRLTAKEQAVIGFYFGLKGDPLSLSEIGKRLGGISRQAVSRIKGRALEKLQGSRKPPLPLADFTRLKHILLKDLQPASWELKDPPFMFSRPREGLGDRVLQVHAVIREVSPQNPTWDVTKDPVGQALNIGGGAIQFDPELLNWAKTCGDICQIPFQRTNPSALLNFRGVCLNHTGNRVWFMGYNALQDYFYEQTLADYQDSNSEHNEHQSRQEKQKEDPWNDFDDWFEDWDDRNEETPADAHTSHDTTSPDLQILGLEETPSTVDELKKAWKRKLGENHPDLGGCEEKAKEINAAYERVKKQIEAQYQGAI